MLASISKEFGVPLMDEELFVETKSKLPTPNSKLDSNALLKKRNTYTIIDEESLIYENTNRNLVKLPKNFIAANIERIGEESKNM
jgi:hypothetical protein